MLWARIFFIVRFFLIVLQISDGIIPFLCTFETGQIFVSQANTLEELRSYWLKWFSQQFSKILNFFHGSVLPLVTKMTCHHFRNRSYVSISFQFLKENRLKSFSEIKKICFSCTFFFKINLRSHTSENEAIASANYRSYRRTNWFSRRFHFLPGLLYVFNFELFLSKILKRIYIFSQ